MDQGPSSHSDFIILPWMASYGSETNFLLLFSARDDLVKVSWKSSAWKCQNQVIPIYFDQLSERSQPLSSNFPLNSPFPPSPAGRLEQLISPCLTSNPTTWPKLLIHPVKIRVFGRNTAKFGSKYDFWAFWAKYWPFWSICCLAGPKNYANEVPKRCSDMWVRELLLPPKIIRMLGPKKAIFATNANSFQSIWLTWCDSDIWGWITVSAHKVVLTAPSAQRRTLNRSFFERMGCSGHQKSEFPVTNFQMPIYQGLG